MELALNDLSLTHCHPDEKNASSKRFTLHVDAGYLHKKYIEFNTGLNAAFPLAVSRFGLGIVGVKCCRGNRQEVECFGSPAEDRLLQRWITLALRPALGICSHLAKKCWVWELCAAISSLFPLKDNRECVAHFHHIVIHHDSEENR